MNLPNQHLFRGAPAPWFVCTCFMVLLELILCAEDNQGLLMCPVCCADFVPSLPGHNYSGCWNRGNFHSVMKWICSKSSTDLETGQEFLLHNVSRKKAFLPSHTFLLPCFFFSICFCTYVSPWYFNVLCGIWRKLQIDTI